MHAIKPIKILRSRKLIEPVVMSRSSQVIKLFTLRIHVFHVYSRILPHSKTDLISDFISVLSGIPISTIVTLDETDRKTRLGSKVGLVNH